MAYNVDLKRAHFFINLLKATNGGAVSQDLILHAMWANRDELNDPEEVVRNFAWRVQVVTGVKINRRVTDGYITYQLGYEERAKALAAA